MFEDVRLETSLILLLSVTDLDKLEQAKFRDQVSNLIKKSCSRKIT